MKQYQYIKLENCVEKELYRVETTDGTEVFFYAGSIQGAKEYIRNGFKVKKVDGWENKVKEQCTYYEHSVNGDESYILMDLNGKDVSFVKWKVTRFSPLVKDYETSNLNPRTGLVFAQNAPHSKPNEESQTMISYWDENVGKDKTVDLDNFTCPCCGKKVDRDYIDGAHIKIVGKIGQYLTPVCKDCNEYKVVNERYFKVNEKDIVKAP